MDMLIRDTAMYQKKAVIPTMRGNEKSGDPHHERE